LTSPRAGKEGSWFDKDGLQPKTVKLPKVSERPTVHLPVCRDEKEGVEK